MMSKCRVREDFKEKRRIERWKEEIIDKGKELGWNGGVVGSAVMQVGSVVRQCSKEKVELYWWKCGVVGGWDIVGT